MDKVCRCSMCGKIFTLGHNGAYLTPDSPEGDWACDSCLKIERDNTPDHATWTPNETEQLRGAVDGSKEFTITRAQAFGNPPFIGYDY